MSTGRGDRAPDPDQVSQARLHELASADAPVARVARLDVADEGGAPAVPVARFDTGNGPARGGDRFRPPRAAGGAADPVADPGGVPAGAGGGHGGRRRGRPDRDRDCPPPDPTRAGRPGRTGSAAADGEPEADPEVVARAICLRLLTDRARSRQELATALRRKGVPDEAADAVLARFGDVGLIDDEAFAGQWVQARHTVRGLGRRALAVELRRKGVADDVAAGALAAIDPQAETERARQLVERRMRGMALGTAQERAVAGRRLAGMLARKGYGAGVAYRVVRDALAELGSDPDEFAAAEPVDG